VIVVTVTNNNSSFNKIFLLV